MILSILDIKRTIIKYIFFTIFILVFGQIYEHFSFGVISKFMVLAPIIPLTLGVFVYVKLLKLKKLGYTESSLYSNGIYTLLIGSILQGVLEIYGTTNRLIWVYLIVGLFLIIMSMITYIKKIK